MKKYLPLLLIFCFLNIAWFGGWQSNQVVNGLTVVNGKVLTQQTTAPKTSSAVCGTGAAVDSYATDFAGKITFGTAVTSCKVTFDSVYVVAPDCVVSTTGPSVVMISADTTAIFMSTAAAVSTYKAVWHCVGH